MSLHYLNMLLYSTLRDQEPTLILTVRLYSLHLFWFDPHSDVSPIQRLVHPSMLEDMFACKQTSKKECERYEVDTGAGVRPGARGNP